MAFRLFIVNFEHISNLDLVFQLLTLSRVVSLLIFGRAQNVSIFSAAKSIFKTVETLKVEYQHSKYVTSYR